MSARRTFTVTFLPLGRTVEVNAGDSVLDAAVKGALPLEHACGGVCACSTCHVIVRQGFEALTPASEREEDMLDNAPCLTTTSRLGCQIEVNADLAVEIPSMTRNQVSEAH